MKVVSCINNREEINSLASMSVDQWVINTRMLSRIGELDLEDLNQLFQSAIMNKRVILNWDILMPERTFQELEKYLAAFPFEKFDRIRVSDLGVIEWLREKNIEKDIELNLETGHHNIEAIQSHLELYPEIKRVILSQELEKEVLERYCGELNVELEYLILGPTLLFYTPRNLLTPFYEREFNQTKTVSGTSEESPHKGFIIVENRHGTFMFNTKDHGLLEHVSDFIDMGMIALRIERGFDVSVELFQEALELIHLFDEYKYSSFKQNYPRMLHKAFFRSNKSDVLFKKLKNTHLSQASESIFAEVLEQKKNSYTALKLHRSLTKRELPFEVRLLTTDGTMLDLSITRLTNALGEPIEMAHAGDLCLVNSLKKASVKALLFAQGKLADEVQGELS